MSRTPLSEKQLAQLWSIISVASVLVMFILMFVFHVDNAWLAPLIGGLIGTIVTFVLGEGTGNRMAQLWTIIAIGSVALMLILMFVVHWDLAWIVVPAGALVGFVCSFFMDKK